MTASELTERPCIDVSALTCPPDLTIGNGDVARGKWIEFERTGISDSGKTELWIVRTASSGQEGSRAIADVRWYAPWRCYAFLPGRQTVFEERCLKEIALFLRLLNAAHKGLRKTA